MSSNGRYECRTIPLTRLIITPLGELKPLCNSCVSLDCENPIEEKKVSVFGLDKVYRVYAGIEDKIVIECQGYINEKTRDQISSIDEDEE